MVKGFEVFQQHFAGYSDQFTLIGGTATMFAMKDAHLEFRATKDLDIVLHVEAHNPAFVGAFWRFVEDGGYEVRQRSTARTGGFHRFQRPTNPDYPAMLELFSRAPDGLPLHPGTHLTPIPMDDAIANLSAILLDEDYYRFILDGRHVRVNSKSHRRARDTQDDWRTHCHRLRDSARAWLTPAASNSPTRGRSNSPT